VNGVRRNFFVACLGMIALCTKAGEDSSLKAMEGKYVNSFPNRLMNGQTYISHNELQLLQVASSAAYFNIHLEWANGHVCNISGVAEADGDEAALVYRKPSIDGKTCKLIIKSTGGSIEFGDEAGACRLVSCGVRGRLDGVRFSFKSREKIEGDSVRQSPNFVRAWEEYREHAAKASQTVR